MLMNRLLVLSFYIEKAIADIITYIMLILLSIS